MSINLGGEQVLLERVECVEVLGKPFTLVVDIIAALGEIDLLPHLGKPVAIKVSEDDDLLREFHGLVSEGEYLRESPNGFHYRLVARPFTFYLAQNRTFAIFQDKSALEIIKQVFDDAGASDVDYTKVSRSYVSRKYCVQYRESDFAFITRLMEEEGLYYYFKHTEDRHTLVLCDSPGAHEQGNPSTLHYNPDTQTVFNTDSTMRSSQKNYIQKLTERVSSNAETRVTLRDFDLEKPERPLQSTTTDTGQHPHDNREVYDYPGKFVDEGHGDDLGKTLLDAMRHDRQTYTGETQSASLACGTKLTVAEHPAARLNAGYLITRTYHSIVSEGYRTGGNDAENVFNVRFEAIPAATPFQLPQATPRPTVDGLETAIVSGPAGEEIFTDEYGRVKVRFHWDRSDTPGEKSTCWVRVAQFGNLGSMILPRVGQEVMVAFLQGDPDKPIVSGWVFNKSLMPIYDLPANKTRALWRTRSYPGGKSTSYPDTETLDTGSPGANELRFEDKAGQEEVFLHAEKDMNVRTRHDQTDHVGHDQDEKVGNNRTAKVGNDETTRIGRNQDLEVTGNQTERIKAKRDVDVTATDHLHVGQSLRIEAGTTIELVANQSIRLTVGQQTITLDQTGIKIEGLMTETKAQIEAKTSALMTSVEGSAMTTVKGGIVMIN